MKGKTPLVDKIRALLELSKSAGDSAEGRAARQVAEKKMRLAGLSEEDVVSDRKVAIGGRVAIWEQALMEVCAEVGVVGLEVDRESSEWRLKGTSRSVDLAVERFHGIRDQLLDASLDYLSEVRRGMKEVGDDPANARSVLDRMRRAFLESATIAVYGRLLEVALEEEKGPEGGQSGERRERNRSEVDEGEAPSRSKEEWGWKEEKMKTPFDKLMARFDGAEDFDWDLEIDVADWVRDPSTAGGEAGVAAVVDAPFPTTSKRRIGGPAVTSKQLDVRMPEVSLFGGREKEPR